MSNWLLLAKTHFQQGSQEVTPKTTETPLLGVLVAPVVRIFEEKGCSANDGLVGTTTASAVAIPDLDRWCWPNGTAINGVEIATFMARLARFSAKGLTFDDGEALADKLLIRDREPDERGSCLECANLAGIGSWHCLNWRQAGVAIKAIDATLPADLVCLLQRCVGFRAGAV
jgi:hypothetical protein